MNLSEGKEIINYNRIITHMDFDGLVSAAICSWVTGCDKFVFTGPNSIIRSEITGKLDDIVCDLPYPLECGLWFDHHPGNLEAVKLRGIDPDSIPGRFSAKPSCAGVIYEYFRNRSEELRGEESQGGGLPREGFQGERSQGDELLSESSKGEKSLGRELPDFFADTVLEADKIDSFDYHSIEEWLRETPGKLVDMSIKAPFDTPRKRTKYLEHATALLRDFPLSEIVTDPRVEDNIRRYRVEEKKMVKIIEDSMTFHPKDSDREIVIVDLLRHNRRPRVVRNLAFLLNPNSSAVVMLNPIFRQDRKMNDFSVSMSLSFTMTDREHGKDIGEIMRTLNIGDGHSGAAAGIVRCGSKVERIKSRKKLLDDIWKLWCEMPG
jgi:hypothetical protein